jgi:hypothetical protein
MEADLARIEKVGKCRELGRIIPQEMVRVK